MSDHHHLAPRALAVGSTVVGGLIGLAWALPLTTAGTSCPVAGEGRAQCLFDDVWLSAAMHIAVCAIALALLTQLVVAAPHWRGRRHARRPRVTVRPAPIDDDLSTASWGQPTDRGGSTQSR